MEMFLVMLPNCWGRGRSVKEADAEARKAGGLRARAKVPRIVWAFWEDATPWAVIDEFGALIWQGAPPIEIERSKPPSK